ncbi:N-terminal acetyltransferase A, auxiliary subunit [Rhizopus microsporus ATCC 52813]|uniref:N-terminal acetyltransferase A, auxiliary subunit n=1 Tax=Rhizopus microsporus ATCC 52813 TaxID=1340429 RepID=A0A2G4SPJ2_RHIZD|nr:N-terminal acetyltransferase A, auxiliary subunit [Rhizopus microsporus ATCC 52813]PHZ10316.1 N-terminal acetyltransferase A, auxiliary subunit [Rhizopus microsporus ATCC 52813]
MAANSKRELPPKEAASFRNLLKNYELRQYKKGLKLAESILKKYPDHGETLAMKGLFLNNLEKKEEGYEYVKKGLLKDLTSHICWHVYGLLYRADKNYEEAAKCYANALKYNKNDPNILRDFAILQTQMRHYDALVETRTKLLESKPQNPPYWLGLAIAYQLVNKPEKAVKVLETFEETKIPGITTDFEKSELAMYQNTLLEETGNYQAALDHLLQIEPKVTDKRSWKEKHALYLLKLDKKEEAEMAYRLLLDENPHNISYVTSILSLKAADKASKNDILAELFTQYPRSKAIEQLILEYAEGESFNVKAEATLQNGLRKGIPSLFASMRRYYANAEKQRVIEDLVVGYSVSLEKNGTFGTSTDKEPPTALLWCWYYLAKHYDYHRQYEKALETINKAIAHTPTVVELYMTKGRILKHSGKVEEAAEVMNEARELDLQDRFINSKCAKYMMRAGRIEEAEKILKLFTRKDVEPVQDLTDMQCQWFMVEEGHAYLRKKEYGKALKRFHSIEKIYTDYYDDQFDFHSYCLRKLTLRAYVNALKWEDKNKLNPFYLKAAKEKLKEEAAKAKTDKKVTDSDPDGEKYVNTEKPLEEALRFIKPLELLAPESAEVNALGFEVYIRQNKLLLAVKALSKIAKVDKKTSCFESRMERFEKAYKAQQKDLDSKITQVIDSQLAEIRKL